MIGAAGVATAGALGQISRLSPVGSMRGPCQVAQPDVAIALLEKREHYHAQSLLGGPRHRRLKLTGWRWDATTALVVVARGG